MSRQHGDGRLAFVALMCTSLSAVVVFGSLQSASPPTSTWDVRINTAELVKRSTKGEPDVPRDTTLLKLSISFHYRGADSDVPAPRIKVRDAAGREFDSLGDTKGGLDKECIVWLSMSSFMAIGLKAPTLPKTKVDSCEDPPLSYYFAMPRSSAPPFTLLFADAAPLAVNLK